MIKSKRINRMQLNKMHGNKNAKHPQKVWWFILHGIVQDLFQENTYILGENAFSNILIYYWCVLSWHTQDEAPVSVAWTEIDEFCAIYGENFSCGRALCIAHIKFMIKGHRWVRILVLTQLYNICKRRRNMIRR